MTLDKNALEAARAVLWKDAVAPDLAGAITAYLSALPGENKELIAEAREFVGEGEGWGGRVLSDWDFWRAKITNGDTSDAPRTWFESVLDSYGERIERLAAALEAADAKVAEVTASYKHVKDCLHRAEARTTDTEARVSELERERDNARLYAAEARLREKSAEDARVAAVDRASTLAAENERMREALRLLHDNIVTAFPSLANLGPVANARAVLTAPAPGGERNVSEDDNTYVIMRRGLFYRADAQGYTANFSEAWRVPLDVAKQHENLRDSEPVTIREAASFALPASPRNGGE